jgi:hypothetical protein
VFQNVGFEQMYSAFLWRADSPGHDELHLRSHSLLRFALHFTQTYTPEFAESPDVGETGLSATSKEFSYPSCQNEGLIEAALGGHEPSHLPKTARLQHGREFIAQ